MGDDDLGYRLALLQAAMKVEEISPAKLVPLSGIPLPTKQVLHLTVLPSPSHLSGRQVRPRVAVEVG